MGFIEQDEMRGEQLADPHPDAFRGGMAIEHAAPPVVRDAIEALGRTEDVRFSPNNRRVAVAGFIRNRITVFDIDISASPAGSQVALTGAIELSSPSMKRPHGLDFIDDDTIIVANRAGDVAIFRLPAGEPGVRSLEVEPLQIWRAGEVNLVTSPGSVSVVRFGTDSCEILVCNNYGHTVTRHALDLQDDCALGSSEVLLRKWLDIPDGVTVSHDRRWIAISNHNTHSVLLYDNLPSLNEHSDPVSILRGISYPHGLRFSSDGRHLLVADAGAPDVHVYTRDGDDWGGVRDPESTIKVLDEAAFLRGHVNPQEGGPKGLDISIDSTVLVVSTEFQPLAFFEVPAMLGQRDAQTARPNGAIDAPMDEHPPALTRREQMALDVSRELNVMELETRAQAAEARVSYMTSSLSWRVTAPLRRLRSLLP